MTSFSLRPVLALVGPPSRSKRREPGSGIGTLKEISSSGSVSASAKVCSIDVDRLARVADDEEGGHLDARRRGTGAAARTPCSTVICLFMRRSVAWLPDSRPR